MVDPIGDRVAGPTRRGAVAGLGGVTVALAVPARAQPDEAGRAASAVTVTGIVFEDRSGLGRQQDGDPGLPGVIVSNGHDVVRTDAAGRCSLTVADGDTVFVVKPSGHRVLLDADNLPRFSYVYRTDEPEAFDVVLSTDPQPESEVELAFVRDTAITSVLGTSAAFGLTTGDILFDDLSLYNRLIGRDGNHHHHVLTAVSGSWWSGPFDRRGIACADSRDGTPNGYHVKPWVSAIPASHVWAARLSANLGPGTHRAEVEATDEYGRTRREGMLIEVVGA